MVVRVDASRFVKSLFYKHVILFLSTTSWIGFSVKIRNTFFWLMVKDDILMGQEYSVDCTSKKKQSGGKHSPIAINVSNLFLVDS